MDKEIGKFFKYPKKTERFGEGGLRIKNINKKPKFSLITVVLNNKELLEKTIKSVLNQNFKNFEYIIIDGGSNDGTLEILKKYNDKIDYWLSERDNGIYDAFNKGMELSKGEYLGIINSDDTYRSNALDIISKYTNKNENIDFIFGSVQKRWGLLSGYKPWKIFFTWGFYTSHSTGFFIKSSSAKKAAFVFESSPPMIISPSRLNDLTVFLTASNCSFVLIFVLSEPNKSKPPKFKTSLISLLLNSIN